MNAPRVLTDDSKKALPAIRAMGSPLILIPANGTAVYATDRSGKDAIVSAFDESRDQLLFAWTGQYKTDVFRLTRQDLRDHYLGSDLKPKTVEDLRERLHL